MKQKNMHRLNEVVHHWIYQDYYGRIKRLEKERIFCRHQMTHLLDVARIAYIKNLEENLGLEKDVIYTAAVLHMIVTNARVCAILVRHRNSVTGRKKRRIWR